MINTSFNYPPIPYRDMDWSATTSDYEPGDLVGYGQTEFEAVADLYDLLEDWELPNIHARPLFIEDLYA